MYIARQHLRSDRFAYNFIYSSCLGNESTSIIVGSNRYSVRFRFLLQRERTTGNMNTGWTLIYNSTSQVSLTASTPMPGTWTVQFSAMSACGLQVIAQSSIQVYYGFSSNIHSDSVATTAIPGGTNYVMVHPTNLNGGTAEYAQIWGQNYQLIASMSLKWRSGCSYNYYSQSFKCPGPFFAVTITGFDEKGYMYQRIGISQCPGASPQTTSNASMAYSGAHLSFRYADDNGNANVNNDDNYSNATTHSTVHNSWSYVQSSKHCLRYRLRN